MDVTSLLNAASTIREESAKDVGSPANTSSRNRTPWDAGGYSLPINSPVPNETSTTDSNNTLEETKDPILASSNSYISSTSNHKPSHSRSSVSSSGSTASTSQQSHHSRLSSVSTVSSFYPLSFITDIEKYPHTSATPTPDQSSEPQTSSIPSSSSTQAFGQVSSTKMAYSTGRRMIASDLLHQPIEDVQKSITPSPTDSLNALAMVAEHQLHDRQEVNAYNHQHHLQDSQQFHDHGISSQDRADLEMASQAYGEEFRGEAKVHRRLTRSASPSDAILIKRNAPMSSSQTTPTSTSGMELPYGMNGRPADLQDMSDSGGGLRNPPLQQRMTHKRAFSAPDFAALGINNPYADRKSMSIGPMAEMTPSPSQYRDQEGTSGVMSQTGPPTPPSEAAQILNKPIVCMYIPDCDTGSQPRKAISHIFGRNKMCTRLIPNFVWVHFCRKHYQRSRYRNSKEYAKLQCDLVKKQIERLHIWSQENARKGEGAIVKDWGIAMRKREQKRLDEMSGKKDMLGFGPDAEGESDDGDNSTAQSRAVPVTAVPSWLVSLCGNGYSTEKIAEIFERLHGEILNDQIPVFPDIEILPNIVVDSDEPKSPKGYTKRRPIATAHKRSVSLGMSLRTDQYPPPRGMSQPISWNPHGMYMESPPTAQKRKRADGGFEEEYNDRPSSQHLRYRGMSMESNRPRMTLAHRPVFQDIHEHEDPHGDQRHYHPYGQSTYPDPQMFDSYGRPAAPLPAPTPQRHPALCTAAQLDSRVASPAQQQYSPYPQPRPRVHQRTQSDMGVFQQQHPQPQQPQQQPYDSPGRNTVAPAVYYAPTVRTNSAMNGMVQGQMRNAPIPQQQQLQQQQQQHHHPRDHFSSPNMYYIGPPNPPYHQRHQSTPVIPRQFQSPPEQQHYLRQGSMGLSQQAVPHRTVEESQRMLYNTRH